MNNVSLIASGRKQLLIRSLIFLVLAVWCAGFVSPFFSGNSQIYPLLFPFLKTGYGKVCHQAESKTFIILGHHLLVCARCTGIYTGALFSAVLALFIFKNKEYKIIFLLLSLIPMLLDVILYSSGAYSYSKIIAFLTGIFSGSVVFVYILAAFEKFFLTEFRKNE